LGAKRTEPRPAHSFWDGRPPRAFTVEVHQSVLEDLRERLARVRWPDRISGDAWAFGTDISYLQDLCTYWRDDYDRRHHEEEINKLHQFKATIGGIDLHFIHERGEGPVPKPLLLTHGWPGSFYEYHKLIPRLTHPSRFGGSAEDAFTVVVPSMPGHGFSFAPNQSRFGLCEIAESLKTLMVDVLRCHAFLAHSHYWGAFVATRLAYAHAEALKGSHITLLAIPRKASAAPPKSREEERYYLQLEQWLREETGCSHIMGTKPQTLAYALTDSPIDLAAWIVEKFHGWSDHKEDIDRHFTRDVLLTNIMIYWVTVQLARHSGVLRAAARALDRARWGLRHGSHSGRGSDAAHQEVCGGRIPHRYRG
jgi:pimeloyl-ACP methyl ester carboxylesterase